MMVLDPKFYVILHAYGGGHGPGCHENLGPDNFPIKMDGVVSPKKS